jgi:hypothetical protein
MAGMRRPDVTVDAGQAELLYVGDQRAMTVSVSTAEPAPQAGTQQVRIGQSTAAYRTDDTGWALWWQPLAQPQSEWIMIDGYGPVKLSNLVSYASGLVRQPMTMAKPFTFTVIPLNLTIAEASESWFTFRPASVDPGADATHKLAVMVDEQMPAGGGTPIKVGDRGGLLVSNDTTETLYVKQPDGRAVALQIPRSLAIDSVDLIQFAAGIRLTKTAQAGKG